METSPVDGMKVAQVVPWLPPLTEGVGSYAVALGRELAARAGIESRLVAAGSARPDEGIPVDASAIRVAAGSGERLAGALAESGVEAVLLHYVNYGYHPRGCPLWLIDGVKRWRAAGAGRQGRRLVTLFHEVYASGPPWSSSFWLSPVQRRLAAELARASDRAATSLQLYRDRLARWIPAARIAAAPVFSTVGEPAAVPPLTDRRPRRLVVFGSAGVRRRAWTGERRGLATACRALGAEEIVDIGPPLDDIPADLDGVPVRRAGLLSDAQVSALLSGAFAGFLAYPPRFLAKSTVFAAYSAHGLLPVCAWSEPQSAGEVVVGRELWHPGETAAPGDPQAIADAARAWYREHSLARQAETFHALLCG
jgi:hypothetical protein